MPYLQQLTDRWFLIGSYVLRLHGIEIESDDIDIVTSVADAQYLANELPVVYKAVTEDNHQSHLFQSYFRRFQVGNYRLEIQGNLAVRVNADWVNVYKLMKNPVPVDFYGHRIFALSLEDNLELYRLFNRPKDLAKIHQVEAYLRK